jgi:ATP-dependent DNA helicase RecQ
VTAAEVLSKYWNYKEFRPGQEQIVNHILAGYDSIALLPTGGGKSICFQVPGLMHDGLTLVISPLIALMKDQVDGLVKRGIDAVALHSGLGYNEIRLKLDNALKGAYRFMYISPERLLTENFREYLPNLNIKLLVVDEAHCISQWGNDFRPAYLKIAECRQWLPNVPIAAFTASAPAYVVQDISDKLVLNSPKITMGSFHRGNLNFFVRRLEDKHGAILGILSKTSGSSLIFVRNRRETEDLSAFLKEKGITCDYYHAGLKADERVKKQDAWLNNRFRVMVCTNAFGMGIDKPDVRFVIHFAPPPSMEDYYQEAGRAGRDGQDSWCILLYRILDSEENRLRVEARFPGREMLKRVYNALMSQLNVPEGGGMLQTYDLDPTAISGRFRLQPSEFLNGLRALELLNFLALSDGVLSPSRVHICADYPSVYDFKVRYSKYEAIIDVLLRSHGGILDDYVKISERSLARRLKLEEKEVVDLLMSLKSADIIDYLIASDRPRVTLLEPRHTMPVFDTHKVETFKQSRMLGIEKMEEFVTTELCRSVWLIDYFTGKESEPCNKCDVCLREKRLQQSGREANISDIRKVLGNKFMSRTQLMEQFSEEKAAEMIETLRWLFDNGFVGTDMNGRIGWKFSR